MVIVKVKKPNAILFDISGTVARETFIEKYLFPFFKLNYRNFLEQNWSKKEMQDNIRQLAEASHKDAQAPKIELDDNNRKESINQIAKYIEYVLENKKESKAFAVLRFLVWFDGYERGKLTTQVYSDVAVTIQKWKIKLNLKLYILSNGWSEATRKFMSKTSHGDLNLMIDDHFDTSIGSLIDSNTFLKVAQKIQQKPGDLLFFTKSVNEGIAAKKAGLPVVLVLTHGDAVDAALQICKNIPIARTFNDIEFD